ncbi:MAG: hypothetical protein JRJ27_12615 [Deltaproteobacteria bacterium]|nr:hypothetical protein [Deltaproteobacteria bacterium]
MKNKKKMKRGKGDGGKGEVLTERNEGVLTWRNGERMGHGFARICTDGHGLDNRKGRRGVRRGFWLLIKKNFLINKNSKLLRSF